MTLIGYSIDGGNMQLQLAIEEALSIDDGMVVDVGGDYMPHKKRSVAAYLAGNKVIYRIPPSMRAWASIDRKAVIQFIMEEIKHA